MLRRIIELLHKFLSMFGHGKRNKEKPAGHDSIEVPGERYTLW